MDEPLNGVTESLRTSHAISEGRAELLRLLLDKQAAPRHVNRLPRRNPPETTSLPASNAQRRMWFIDKLDAGNAGYQIPISLRLRGPLDRSVLSRALDRIVQRHEVLRTVFVPDGDALKQFIAAEGHFALSVHDLSAFDGETCKTLAGKHKIEEICGRFDLSAGPLIRGRLLILRPGDHILLITMHHIVSDGWSKQVLIRELTGIYAAYVQGRNDPHEKLQVQYADYVAWYNDSLRDRKVEAQLSYWVAHLAGSTPQLNIPTDRSRPVSPNYAGRNVPVELGAQLSRELHGLAQRHRVTLFMVLYAAWALMLARLTGQSDVVIGTPLANRQRPEFEGLIGLFVNTLALRVEARPDMGLAQFLAEVKRVTLAAFENQDAPFDEVVEALRLRRSGTHNPLFQTAIALQNMPQSELRLPGVSVSVEGVVDEPSILDMIVILELQGEQIVGTVNYSTDLFDHDTIRRWIERFRALLAAMTEGKVECIGDLNILPDNECDQLIECFNHTDVCYPNDQSIVDVFEKWVSRTPNAVAIANEDSCLTYAQLNHRANQFAHCLMAQGVEVGEYVAVVMPRSWQMIVAQVAVLKCGGAYVPVDPALPLERQAFIVDDCETKWVVGSGRSSKLATSRPQQWIDFADVMRGCAEAERAELSLRIHPLASAYVMYTSGSTGAPKGVVIAHRAVNRLVINSDYARITPADCIAHCSNTSFDASTFEIWGALLNGASVFIVSQSTLLDDVQFEQILRQHRCSALFLTTALFHQFACTKPSMFGGLSYLLIGGEACDPGAVRRVLEAGAPRRLMNVYGPTETTTFATSFPIVSIEDDARSVPIGRPIANTKIYILDGRMHPVPVGVTGEICIGGAGVALGYLKQPGLTAQRFSVNPFDADASGRLYHSGDRGRWRSDGTVEFLGRDDHQIKLRGFRVELGEIESLLLQHGGVQEAVVLAREDLPGSKRLVAYVAAGVAASQRGARKDLVRELLQFARERLPEYMVPAECMVLERLPLTTNGKVDRSALPVPQERSDALEGYVAPRSDLEERVAAIWKQILGVSQVGAGDSFFELGGTSLSAMRVIAEVRDSLHVELPLRDLFIARSLDQFAKRVELEMRGLDSVQRGGEEALAQRVYQQISELSNAEVEAQLVSLERELAGVFDEAKKS